MHNHRLWDFWFILSIFFLPFFPHCKAKAANIDKGLNVVIPFTPANCINCNIQLPKFLSFLDSQKISYTFLLNEEYSDDLQYVKSEFNLEKYPDEKFIFNSSKFDEYLLLPQSYVLENQKDSSYHIFTDFKSLQQSLATNVVDTLVFDDYKTKKSTSQIFIRNMQEIYFQNGIQTSIFDYLNLKRGDKVITTKFSDTHLTKNFELNFIDTFEANKRLKETEIVQIPNKNELIHFEYVDDSLFASSQHTFVESFKDSTLGVFTTINIYKDGKYLFSRSVDKSKVPEDYYVLPFFHRYGNAMYFVTMKSSASNEKANHFLAKFVQKGNSYVFDRFLGFTLPPISKEVGYQFMEIKFSKNYCMHSLSNNLYDLEEEKVVPLNIPQNEAFTLNNLTDKSRNLNVLLRDFSIELPHVLLSYYSRIDGKEWSAILKYDVQQRGVVEKVVIPHAYSRFIKPDQTKFGYFIWTPEKDNNDKLVYKKVF